MKSDNIGTCVLHYAIALLPVIAFSLTGAFLQIIDRFIPIIELLVGQFLVQALSGLPSVLLALRHTRPEPERRHVIAILLVTVTRLALELMFSYSYYMMPAGIAQGVYNISSTCACILYDLCRKRKCTLNLWLPLLFAVAGIILTSQPGFLGFNTVQPDFNYTSICFKGLSNSSNHNYNSSLAITEGNISDHFTHCSLQESYGINQNCTLPNTALDTWKTFGGYLLASLSGISQSIGFIIQREYLHDLSPMTINVCSVGLCTVISAFSLLFIGNLRLPTNSLCWLLTFGYMLFEGVGLTINFFSVQQIGPTALAILLDFTPVVMLIFQYTFLSQIRPGHRNWEEILGMILLTVAIILYPALTLREERKQSEYEQFDNDKDESRVN